MTTQCQFDQIDSSILIEEETLGNYKAEHYFPVAIGQLFNGRYRTITKLGYGSASTVWLCHDIFKPNTYVALKVYINCLKIHRELEIYRHIQSLSSNHEGRHHIREFLDSFEVDGPHGRHICLVHEPLGMTFDEVRSLTIKGVLDEDFIRQAFRYILAGLEFLHKKARVIHTDIQPNNMLLGVHDTSVFDALAELATVSPVPRKELQDRVIYVSQAMPLTSDAPSLSDFSEARFGDKMHTGIIMPNVYRAPEVILGMDWSYPVDVWGLGMTLWDLFQPERLFSGKDGDGKYSECHHLAQMVAILGDPPSDFLKASERSTQYWDQDGKWKHEVAIPELSLESCEKRLSGQEKVNFLIFMRKMLRWRPEDRSNWRDIYYDEWLLADLIESGEVVRED